MAMAPAIDLASATTISTSSLTPSTSNADYVATVAVRRRFGILLNKYAVLIVVTVLFTMVSLLQGARSYNAGLLLAKEEQSSRGHERGAVVRTSRRNGAMRFYRSAYKPDANHSDTSTRTILPGAGTFIYQNLFDVDLSLSLFDVNAATADSLQLGRMYVKDNFTQTNSVSGTAHGNFTFLNHTLLNYYRATNKSQWLSMVPHSGVCLFNIVVAASNDYLQSGCRYSADYNEIVPRLPPAYRNVTFLLQDGDAVEVDTHVTAKSRAIPTRHIDHHLTYPHHTHITVLPMHTKRFLGDEFVTALSDPYSYYDKKPIAFWRGTTTGQVGDCWNRRTPPPLDWITAEPASSTSATTRTGKHSFETIYELPNDDDADPFCARWSLATRWSLWNTLNHTSATIDASSSASASASAATADGTSSIEVDIGLSYLCQNVSEATYGRYVRNQVELKDLLSYRYLVSVEGNDVASNLLWSLASNSVVFMPPPTKETFAMEHLLVPWYHYVPLRYDTTDLLDKVRYCNQNSDQCMEIAQNGQRWVHGLADRNKVYDRGAQILKLHIDVLIQMGVLPPLQSTK